MNSVKVQAVSKAIEATNGKFFTVTFEKADGSIRVMNCRTGVKKHLKGGTSTYSAKDQEQKDKTIGVYEQASNGYRCFKASRVKSLVIGGNKITFED